MASDTSTDHLSQTEEEEIVQDPVEVTNMSIAQQPAPPPVAAPTAISDNPPPPEPSQRCTTFTRFPFLSPENRLQIWQCMFPAPRILHINYDLLSTTVPFSHSQGYRYRGQWRFFNEVNASNLPTLHICQESRFETLNNGYEPMPRMDGSAKRC